MDEATPHLHIDFIPYTTGSKRGLETRVSLKKALAELGFKGGTRSETERNQWVAAEKERLAEIMLQHGIEWEKKGTHEKHLLGLDFEKQERQKEVAELEQTISGSKEELNVKWQLAEPGALMSAKAYRDKKALPLVEKLKEVVKNLTIKCVQLTG